MSSPTQMVATGVAFIIIPVPAVALRLWAKRLSPKGLGVDDYLIVSALAFSIACCVAQIVGAVHGMLAHHTILTADGSPDYHHPRFVVYERCKFTVNLLSTIGLGLTKASILIFYQQIFTVRSFLITTYIMMAIVFSWTVAFFLTNLFACWPVTIFQEIAPNCMDVLSMWYASAVSDVIVDIVILLMPIPMVMRLRLPRRQKIGVLGMFLLGAIVCGASIARCYYYFAVGFGLPVHWRDNSYYIAPVVLVTCIELSLGVVSACLPTYRRIWVFLRGKRESSKMSPRISQQGYSKSQGSKVLRTWDNIDEESEELRILEPQVNVHGETTSRDSAIKLDPNTIKVERDIRIQFDSTDVK